MRLKLFLFLVLAFLSVKIRAQDPVFTQYFLVPETLNPAFTGTLNAWYAGTIHRVQWPDANKKLETNYAYINGPLDIDGKMGAGVTVLNHHEVFTDYNYLQVNAVLAYNVELNSDWKLRLGIESGFGNKNYNFGNLILEDQINSNTGAITGNSGDSSLLRYKEKINFFDISSGLLLYNDNAWIGTSLKHLSKPNISFTEVGNVPLSMFLSIHAGYAFDIDNYNYLFNDGAKLLLTANYMRQSQYNRIDLGSAVEFNQFTIGALAALNPERKNRESHMLTSVNVFTSVQLSRFVLGYSYDINVTSFGNSQGIHELSLTYQLGRLCSTCNNYLVKRPWGRNY